MVWAGKQLTAKEILGMEPTELQTKLDGAASKDDVSKLNTAVEAQKDTLAAIQASLAKLTTPPDVPDPQAALDQNDPTTQVLTDPAGFVNRQTAPIQQAALQAQANINEMRARQANPGVFQKYGDALMEALKRFPLAAQAQTGFWDSHIRMVLGDKFIKGEIEEGSYPSLIGGSSFGPNPTGETKDPNMGINPEIAAWLKDRNVPIESAARLMQMQQDGSEINLANYKGVKIGHA